MNPYIKKLNDHLKTWSPNYGDPEIETILEFLWYAYTTENPIYNDTIKQGFADLWPVFDALSLENADLLLHAVCGLCQEHEHMAFLAGIHVGAKLTEELA